MSQVPTPLQDRKYESIARTTAPQVKRLSAIAIDHMMASAPQGFSQWLIDGGYGRVFQEALKAKFLEWKMAHSHLELKGIIRVPPVPQGTLREQCKLPHKVLPVETPADGWNCQIAKPAALFPKREHTHAVIYEASGYIEPSRLIMTLGTDDNHGLYWNYSLTPTQVVAILRGTEFEFKSSIRFLIGHQNGIPVFLHARRDYELETPAWTFYESVLGDLLPDIRGGDIVVFAKHLF